MKFFDSNACFGKDVVNHACVNHENFIMMEKVELAETAAELIEKMDYAGIEKAMVWYRPQFDRDPLSGNEEMMEQIKGYEDRLLPTWTILPAITDTDFAPETFFDKMKANNVKALRAYPENNRYFLCDVTMGEQLNAISQLRIPLYLTPMFGWETVYKVLEEFPDLTVVLSNIGWWPSARLIWPLLKRYPNFYFETGDFSQPHGLEEVCQKFGSHRVLYGSNFPTNAPAGSIYTLLKAKITDEERENIAHRNMERLLSEVKL